LNIEKTFLPLQPNIKQPKNPAYEKNVKKKFIGKKSLKKISGISHFLKKIFSENLWTKIFVKNFGKKFFKATQKHDSKFLEKNFSKSNQGNVR
tara:strand:+ start:109 stop:387 length:279 start_codon:yes stop_codon:yes gene_type:complete